MRRALTIALLTLTPLMASCAGRALPLPGQPPRPLPAWTSSDFDCGDEPAAPPQMTTKARAEVFQLDTTAWGRSCQTMLKARGADAARYGLVEAKAK